MKRMIMATVLCLLMALTLLPAVAFAATDGCIAFTSAGAFTLEASSGKTWNGTLEYSTDGTSWTEWNGAEIAAAASGSEYKLLLRGTGNTVITGSNNGSKNWRLNGSNIACTGNIENLLDHATVTNGNHPTMGNNCFMWMFYNCAALTSAPDLSATTLADGCYIRMFSDTGITKAPALPATDLKYQCYIYMFGNCTALTEAPALPAATMEAQCYYGMFNGCTSLTTAPNLPATELEARCFVRMFAGCTSLTTAPALPVTTLEPYCYFEMFSGCTALTSAPALPATVLNACCYSGMFQGCTALTSAPELPGKALVEYCYNNMLNGSGVAISETQTDEYNTPWRIPTEGTATQGYDWNKAMLTGTKGPFTGDPQMGVTYYQKKTVPTPTPSPMPTIPPTPTPTPSPMPTIPPTPTPTPMPTIPPTPTPTPTPKPAPAPKAGDTSRPALLIGLTLLALCGIAVTAVQRKKVGR